MRGIAFPSLEANRADPRIRRRDSSRGGQRSHPSGVVARGPAGPERAACSCRPPHACGGVPQARGLTASAVCRISVCRLSGPVNPDGEGSAWAAPRRVRVASSSSRSRRSASVREARPAASRGVAPARRRARWTDTASACPADCASNAAAPPAGILSALPVASAAPGAEWPESQRASVRTADVTPCRAPLDAPRAWLVTACDKHGEGADHRGARRDDGSCDDVARSVEDCLDSNSTPIGSRPACGVLRSIRPQTLWCRGPARDPFKVEIEGSNPSRVAKLMPLAPARPALSSALSSVRPQS